MNTITRLNDDKIAGDYNQRYPESQQWERGQALLEIATRYKNGTVLEVGSGTGFWLNCLIKQLTNYSVSIIRLV